VVEEAEAAHAASGSFVAKAVAAAVIDRLEGHAVGLYKLDTVDP
jgi:hypothetical protein